MRALLTTAPESRTFGRVLCIGVGSLCLAVPAWPKAPQVDAPSPLALPLVYAASVGDLPDAPSFTTNADPQVKRRSRTPPCPADGEISPGDTAPAETATAPPCPAPKRQGGVVDEVHPAPLTSEQKGGLAVHEVIDPFNLLVLTGQAALSIAVNSHTAYGPGFKGFGKLTGYALLGDATGSFFGVYAIPSLVHEDPRYHRMPNARISRRILHAVAHTVIAEGDDGHTMPNYATLGTYVITAEIANLYVPGVQCNAPSTARRIGVAIATDPIGNIVAEFLPDVARHIHLKSVFFQQIVNQVALGTGPGGAP